jgi:hypothetical protein
VAQREEQASVELRLLVERVLQETAEDLRVQCSNVDQAFSQRCLQLTEAKTQLQLHLSQVCWGGGVGGGGVCVCVSFQWPKLNPSSN